MRLRTAVERCQSGTVISRRSSVVTRVRQRDCGTRTGFGANVTDTEDGIGGAL